MRNKMIFGWVSLIIISLFFIDAASALESITATLEEGKTETYNLNGVNYEITIASITDVPPFQVRFVINSNNLPIMISGDAYDISDNVQIEVNEISPMECGDVSCDSVDFSLTTIDYSLNLRNICGDDVCDDKEDCSSCEKDCRCNSGFECQNSKCIEIIKCGDNKCIKDETCIEDSCCNGIKADFTNDEKNCGECYNECTTGYKCTQSKCIMKSPVCGDGNCEEQEKGQCKTDCKWCGDGSCDSSESCSSCYSDCSCGSGLQCKDNKCASMDECSANSECNDNDKCTADICTGTPKKCSYTKIHGCNGQNNSSEAKETGNNKELLAKQSSNEEKKNVTKEKIVDTNITVKKQIEDEITREEVPNNLIQRLISLIFGWFGR